MSAKSVILYARFSSLGQAKGYSLERQVELGKQFAEEKGWTVERVIKDEGKSAFHGRHRSEGAALYEFEREVEQGHHKGKVLLIENMDRLTRQGGKESLKLVWFLNENGVDVVTRCDGRVREATSDKNELLNAMFDLMEGNRGESESQRKRELTQANWEKRYAAISNGQKPIVGSPPAWIDRKGDRYFLNEQRVALLNEIYELYIGGVGVYKIVQTLNERGEPSWTNKKVRKANGWYPAYVWRLLTHRAAIGEYVTLKGELLSSDYFPQAVSEHKFYQAQEIREQRKNTGGRDRVQNNLLQGMVKCQCCGGTMGYENKGRNSVTNYTTVKGEKRSYARKFYQRLRCDANRRKRLCGNAFLFDYAIVENVVLDELLALAMERTDNNPMLNQLDEQLARQRRVVENLQEKIDNLIEAIAEGAGAQLAAAIARLEQEHVEAVAELKRLTVNREIEEAKPSPQDDAVRLKAIRDSLTDEDTDKRYAARSHANKMIARLVEGLSFGEDGKFTIQFDTGWVGAWKQYDDEGNYVSGGAY